MNSPAPEAGGRPTKRASIWALAPVIVLGGLLLPACVLLAAAEPSPGSGPDSPPQDSPPRSLAEAAQALGRILAQAPEQDNVQGSIDACMADKKYSTLPAGEELDGAGDTSTTVKLH